MRRGTREAAVALLLTLGSACSCPGPAPDGGVPDAGTPDASVPDAGAPDASTPDSGAPDAGRRDAGTLPDAGTLRCLGVQCVGDTTCSLDDGDCRCSGAVCPGGQTCQCPQGMPGCQPNERVCVASTRCDAVLCEGATSCDLADGLCKCTGPGGPACGDMQFCGATFPPQCQGGCAQLCEAGMSCDPDDLTCKCGGRGGIECTAGEVCISLAGQYMCRLACAPVGGVCPAGQRCVIDQRTARGAAYCAFPSALLFEGEQCTHPTQCAEGHCAGLTGTVPMGTCREGCDPQAPSCPAGRRCLGLQGPRDAGFCVP